MSYRNISIVEDFFNRSDPSVIWDSLFGCSPVATDIQNGMDSSASIALEQAVASFEEKIDAYVLGADFPLEIVNSKKNVDLIRRKLLSAAILQFTAEEANRDVSSQYHNFKSAGVIAFVGDFENSASLLSNLGCDYVSEFFKYSDKSNSHSPVFISSGDPELQIETLSRDQIKEIFSMIIDEHIYKFVVDNEIDILDIAVKNEVFDFSSFVNFANYDDRCRLNEIIRNVRKRVDYGDDIHEAVLKAPYKNTLIQNITDRLLDNFSSILESYGFKKTRENTYSVSYKSPQSIKKVIYRMLGDSKFHLMGLSKKEFVKSTTIFLPIGDNLPTIALINADKFSVMHYKEVFGESDLVIGLPESQEIDDFYEINLGNGLILDENSIFDPKFVLKEMEEMFEDFSFKK